MKRCPMCREIKTKEDFYAEQHRRDGLSTYCRPCRRAYRRAYKQTVNGRKLVERWIHSKRNLANQRQWRQQKGEAYRAYLRERYHRLYAPGQPRYKKYRWKPNKHWTDEQKSMHRRASLKYARRPEIRQAHKERYMNRTEEKKERDRAYARELRSRLLKTPVMKKRADARLIVRLMIRHGWLKKQPCRVCGTTEHLEAHHETYEDPLALLWLCRSHHKSLHVAARDAAREQKAP